MRLRPELHNILTQLQEVDNGDIIEAERNKKNKTAAKRAQAAAGEEAVAAGKWFAGRKVLDLNDLGFAQGGHHMSNRKLVKC